MGVALSKSLFIKQAVLTFFLAVILSLISSSIQIYEGMQSQKTQIDNNFNELIAVVEKPLAEAVFRLDTDFAQQQVDSLLQIPSVASVEVLDEMGNLFVGGQSPKRSFSVSYQTADQLLSDLQSYERSLHLSAPVFEAGKLTIVPEKRYLITQLLSDQSSILIYNLAKDLVLAFLVSLFFYFLVTYPLTRLTESLSELKAKSSLLLPASLSRFHQSDELGHLHATFAQLWKKLNTALSDLERSDAHTKAMIENAADGIMLLNECNRIILVNSAAEYMLKNKSTHLYLHSLEALHAPASWHKFAETLETLQINQPLTVETVYRVHGIDLPVEIRLAKFKIQDKVETMLLIRDVSKRKATEAHIHHLAYYDPITKLPNRQYLTDELSELLERQQHSVNYSAVVFMDLDRFKTINDSLGHSVGDQLLCAVASQLSFLKEDNVVFARMGGDEFAFLLTCVGNNRETVEKSVCGFAQSVMYACQQVKKAGHHEIHITASLGAAIFKGKEFSTEVILKQADTALYRAKESGRNTFAIYRAEMQAVSDARLVMEKALHHATEFKLFELYYQPQSDDKNELIGAEALIRWKDGEKGFISPAEFIPVAEEIGLIVEIGQWVMDEALSQVARWIKEGKWQLCWRISINVSPVQFQQTGFLPMVKAQLDKHDVPASCVDLEITENMLLNDLAASLKKMHDIKALGVHLSIDDFGTGYSSLKYLKLLPIDRLKIDQSFVRDLLEDKSDEAIVLAVIAMAKALGIGVIAEGVETWSHHDRLREINCVFYQGYYYGRPLPPAEFITAFVDNHPVCPNLTAPIDTSI